MSKNVHFIGIAGSAIAPLAVMMGNLGWRVTGSEHNRVWEPAKSLLARNEIKYTEMEYDLSLVRNADLVIIGNSALLSDTDHPEFIEAQKLNKEIQPFPYLVGKFITKDKSIVITGSYGKSSITSAVAYILDKLGKKPAFMLGGKPLDFSEGVRAGLDTQYSVVEGDEYISAMNFDMKAKFLYYEPKYTLITSLKWDHADLYRTLDDYVEAFRKLVLYTEQNQGAILFNANGENMDKLQLDKYNLPKSFYSMEDVEIAYAQRGYIATDISTDGGFTVLIKECGKCRSLGKFKTRLIGIHNIENMLAAVAMVHQTCESDLDIVQLQNAVQSFSGVSRRLEIVGKTLKGALLVDDFAHSPVKAKATLTALRQRYPDKKILAIYYPRLSLNQNRETLKWYPGCFDAADEVIVPRIIAKKDTPREDRVYGKDIVEAIGKSNPNVKYMPIEESMIEYVLENSDEETIIVIMSAGGIDEVKLRMTDDE